MSNNPSHTARTLASGTPFGKYRIEKLLGRGGMGHVYLALDTSAQRLVALKLISPEAIQEGAPLERFKREAAAASRLDHPNICKIYEFAEFAGQYYIAMEYVDGTTVEDRLRAGPLSVLEVIRISFQIAAALQQAHAQKIVHRDIKSGNIMLSHTGQVKLLDFGLAKVMDSEAQGLSSLTKTGSLVGTTLYLSPEQALGQKVDHRSDIFSFGIVLYEMLSGRLPFSGRTPIELIEAILRQDPVPVTRYNENVPDSLSRLVAGMLQKTPSKRYQSTAEIIDALQKIQGELQITEKHSAAVQRQRLSKLKQSAILIAIAIAMILAAILLQ